MIVSGRPSGEPAQSARMLIEAFDRSWPAPGEALFTVTPGGFIVGDFPPRWRGGVGWDSRDADFAPLIEASKPSLEALLTPAVLSAARKRTRYLTNGVDLFGPSGSHGVHAELVAVVHAVTGRVVRWTGKSYPTDDQQELLVQVTDFESHLLEVEGERVLVLGRHDLNLFSNRAYGNQRDGSVKRVRCDTMRALADRLRPTIACSIRIRPTMRRSGPGRGAA